MSKIFAYQTALKIEARVKQDITGATCIIKYTKPDGSTSDSWPGTIDNATNGVFYYELLAGDLDEVGDWLMWSHVTFSDGKTAPGEVVTVTIYDEGSKY